MIGYIIYEGIGLAYYGTKLTANLLYSIYDWATKKPQDESATLEIEMHEYQEKLRLLQEELDKMREKLEEKNHNNNNNSSLFNIKFIKPTSVS